MFGEQQTFPVNPQSNARRSPVSLAIMLAVVLGGLSYLSFDIAGVALRLSGCPLWIVASLWAIAGFLMLVPVWITFLLLRRKITTGRFLVDPAVAAAKRAEMQKKIGAGKPFWPQASVWVLPILAGLFFLIVGSLVIAGAVSVGPSSPKPFIGLFVLASVLLFTPFYMIYKAARRKRKTGSVLPSEEEFTAARFRCAKPQPLWRRVIMAVAMLLNAALQTDIAIGRLHHGHGSYGHTMMALCFWAAISVFWIWWVFRPQTQGGLPPESQHF